MPKFPTIPQMTVVVPHLGCAESFEDTLASVLQHRNHDCEVVVTHDGGYDDPFSLGDEVRFVESSSDRLMDQLRSGAAAAHGRFVNVLTDGCRATDGWADAAMEAFDKQAIAFVTPVVCDPVTREPIHTGWVSGSASPCQPSLRDSQSNVSGQSGAFLNASFWRRDVLRASLDAYRGNDMAEASVVLSQTVLENGSCMGIADKSWVISGAHASELHQMTRQNQRRCQALVDQFHGGGWLGSLTQGLRSALTGNLAGAFQRATAPLAYAWADRVIAEVELTQGSEASTTLDATRRLHSGNVATRRAA